MVMFDVELFISPLQEQTVVGIHSAGHGNLPEQLARPFVFRYFDHVCPVLAHNSGITWQTGICFHRVHPKI